MWYWLIMLYKVVLTAKHQCVTIKMKATEQYFFVVPLIGLCNFEVSD